MMLSRLVKRGRQVESAYWQTQEVFREERGEKRSKVKRCERDVDVAGILPGGLSPHYVDSDSKVVEDFYASIWSEP